MAAVVSRADSAVVVVVVGGAAAGGVCVHTTETRLTDIDTTRHDGAAAAAARHDTTSIPGRDRTAACLLELPDRGTYISPKTPRGRGGQKEKGLGWAELMVVVVVLCVLVWHGHGMTSRCWLTSTNVPPVCVVVDQHDGCCCCCCPRRRRWPARYTQRAGATGGQGAKSKWARDTARTSSLTFALVCVLLVSVSRYLCLFPMRFLPCLPFPPPVGVLPAVRRRKCLFSCRNLKHFEGD